MEYAINFSDIPQDVKDIIWRLTDCEQSFKLQCVCKEWSMYVWSCRHVWSLPRADGYSTESTRTLIPFAKMPNLKRLRFDVFDWNATELEHWKDVCSSIASMTKLIDLELDFVAEKRTVGAELLSRLLESLRMGGALSRLQRFAVRSKFYQIWSHPTEVTQKVFVSVICQNMKLIRHLELPANFISQHMIPGFITEVSRNLKHLEYLGAFFIGFEDDWRELSALEHLRSLSFELNCRGLDDFYNPARRIRLLLDEGLVFVNLLLEDGSNWIAHCIKNASTREDLVAIVELLDHYQKKGINIRSQDAGEIISHLESRTWFAEENFGMRFLRHPVVLDLARTDCDRLHEYGSWFKTIGFGICKIRDDGSSASTEEEGRRAMEMLFDTFFSSDPLEKLSTHLQRVAGAITHAALFMEIEAADQVSRGLPAGDRSWLFQMCLDRFPNIIYTTPKIFSALILCRTALAVEVYHKATPEIKELFLIGGDGTASVLDSIASSIIPDLSKYVGVDEIIRLGIAKINEGVFDATFSAPWSPSPMAKAIRGARPDVVKFLLSHGYQIRHRRDCPQAAFADLLRQCSRLEDFEYLLTFFDAIKSERLDVGYYFRRANPIIIDLLIFAANRGFSFDIPVENVVVDDEIDWMKLAPSDLIDGSIQKLLDAAIRSCSRKCLRWLVVEKGGNLYESKTLMETLKTAMNGSFVVSALCECGFDFARPAPLSGGVRINSLSSSRSYLSHLFDGVELDRFKLNSLEAILCSETVSVRVLFPAALFAWTDSRKMLFSEPYFSKYFSSLDASALNLPLGDTFPPLLLFLVERYPSDASRCILPLLKLRQDWDLLTPIQGRNVIDSFISFLSAEIVVQHIEPLIRELYPHCAPYFFVSLCRKAEKKFIQWNDMKPLFDFVNERFPREIKTLRVRGHTAFMHAAIASRLEFVKPLYETGFYTIADEETCTTALICVVEFAQRDSLDWAFETARYLLAKCTASDINYVDRKGRTALFFAAFVGSLEVVKLLIQAGASLTPSRDAEITFLALSNCINSPDILRVLLESLSTDVELRLRALNYVDSSGRTLLMKACFLDAIQTSKLLLEFGADVELESKEVSSTPLIEAAKIGSASLCSELLRRGARLTSKDSEGKRAVDYARSESLRHMLTPEGEQPPTQPPASLSWASNLGTAAFASVPTQKNVSNTGGSLLQRKRAQKPANDDEAALFFQPAVDTTTGFQINSASTTNTTPAFAFPFMSGFTFGATQTSTSSATQTPSAASASTNSSTTTTTTTTTTTNQQTKSFSGFGGFNLNL